MKKHLLLGTFALCSILSVNAQELQSDNFNDLTVGNIGTNLTAETAGQGGWYTYIANEGQNSDFQIVDGGEMGNTIQITGASVASGTTNETDNTRWAFRDGEALLNAWNTRTEGNNVVKVNFDFYPTLTEGSTTLQRLALYGTTDGDSFRVLGGIQFNASTGELSGVIYYSQGQQSGTFQIAFADGDGLIITPDQWIHMTYAFDTTTGDAVWSSDDIMVDGEPFYGSINSPTIVGAAPVELDLTAIAGTNNAAANSMRYDNITVSASGALGTKTIAAAPQLSVYPNPATDVINISNTGANVNNITIADLNGRIVKSVKFNGVTEAQINLSDISAGMYLMTVSSDKGSTSKKIFKQ